MPSTVTRLGTVTSTRLIIPSQLIRFPTERVPPGFGFLVDQLNRAALSIATNVADVNSRFTKPTTGSSVMPGRLGPSQIDRQQNTSPSPAILPENGEVAKRTRQ